MTLREQKQELRKHVEQRRTALPAELRLQKSYEICKRTQSVLAEMPWPAGQVLMTYIPVRAEVDVSPLVEWAWRQGIAVAAPRSLAASRKLVLHLISGWDQLKPGTYGIREPRSDCPLLPDDYTVGCVIVPGIAFDANGGRLGYGGGYYDRFFNEMTRQRKERVPFKLALAFDAQIVSEVPMDMFDVRVDRVVTESCDYMP